MGKYADEFERIKEEIAKTKSALDEKNKIPRTRPTRIVAVVVRVIFLVFFLEVVVLFEILYALRILLVRRRICVLVFCSF